MKNRQKAHLLLIVFLFMLAVAADAAVYHYAPANSTDPLESFVNDTRGTYGLPPLKSTLELEDMAMERCHDQERFVTISHDGFVDRAKWSGYSKVGENLASGFSSDKATINAWLASPPHKAAMLGDWKYTGVAKCGKYDVQLFAK